MPNAMLERLGIHVSEIGLIIRRVLDSFFRLQPGGRSLPNKGFVLNSPK